MARKQILLLVLALGVCFQLKAQSPSVLSTGEWVKLAIPNSGIYKIDFSSLEGYGIDPSSIDPRTIRLFGHNSGMLPQQNNIEHQEDPEEISIFVSGEGDGSFDANDYVLFYGQGPDIFEYDSIMNVFYHEKNLYSDSAYYFLNISLENGQRIAMDSIISGSFPLITTFNHGFVHESEIVNLLHSGRRWFGENFDLTLEKSFSTDIVDILPNTTISLISSVMGSSFNNSAFTITSGSQVLGQQVVNAVPQGTYALKGSITTDSLSFSSSQISSLPLELTYKYEKQSGVGYLDYFILNATCSLIYRDKPLSFYSSEAINQQISTYQVTECPEGLMLWNISNKSNPKEIAFNLSNGAVIFNAQQSEKRFILFEPLSSLSQPVFMNKVTNQNLHSLGNVDLLIVTNSDFLSAANEIAGIRTQEGLIPVIVTTDQVFNEYSAGKHDITAIRNLAKQLYDNGSLKYLLILGKGTFDHKNIMGNGLTKVPIYESRNSLQPLATYGSDDYLGFLADGKGEWLETNQGDLTLDIGVGRLPVKTIDDANNIVEKLQLYKQQFAIGAWRKEVYFVAEDGDVNIHQRDADRLATLIDTVYSDFNTNKIYVDAYPIEVNPGFRRAPDVNNAILTAIENGAFIINYTGHGNEVQWAKSKIFDLKMIDSIENDYRFPVFVTATCEFGRHDDFTQISGAEELIIKYKSGSIAMVTTSRPVFSSSNYILNLAFYNQVFEKPGGSFQRIGDIFFKTKNNSLSGVLNRNFALLGDPSMKLSYAAQTITIDSLNGNTLFDDDTLRTQELTELSGVIREPSGLIDSDFSGTVSVVLFDKSTQKETLGNSTSPFRFKERDNILFRGDATINNGRFNITFVIPKDISYNAGKAKISLYASEPGSAMDASGANIKTNLGFTSKAPYTDVTPPQISVFIGDTTFVNGSSVIGNTLLIIKLFDESGINISGNQIGHSITYTLDDAEPVQLNDYYYALKDNYRKGIVNFPLNDLGAGSHQLTITAWDTFNNVSNTQIEFVVSEKNINLITDLGNYPNPMTDRTNFIFTHMLPGEDIEFTVQIIARTGQTVFSETRSYFSAPSVINDWEWDGRNSTGGKLNEGLYIYSVILRSIDGNRTDKRYSRLIISN